MLLFLTGLVVGVIFGALIACGGIALWMAQIGEVTNQQLEDE